MKKTALAFIFILFLASFVQITFAQQLTVYTEEFPPFNFTQDGKITGVSTEVVQRVLSDAGFKVKIVSLPWEQAYKISQKKENALIYSISRRPNREKLFKWAGILAPSTYSIFSLKSRNDININRLEDLKKYRIAVVKDDARETYLLGKGFKLSDFSRIGGDDPQNKNLKKLIAKQVDVWPMPDAVAYFVAKQQGYDNPADILKKVFPLDELTGGYYLAASLYTSDQIVARITSALERFKQDKVYQSILDNWGLTSTGVVEFAHINKLAYAIKHLIRMDRVGFLAADAPSSHSDARWIRRGIREEVIERYVSDFNEWRQSFVELQSQVDALILGNNSGIQGWDGYTARKIAQFNTKIPTGCVMEWMADYAVIGYSKGNLLLNRKIANTMGIKFPQSFIKKATMIID